MGVLKRILFGVWVAGFFSPAISAADKATASFLVGSDNFYRFLNEVYYGKNKDSYIGKTFEITGMKFYDTNNFFANQAYVGRYLMMCCSADAMVAGFYIQGDKLASFKNETWIKVRGKIEKKATPQGQVAVILFDTIAKTGEETPYIVPSLDETPTK